MRRLPGRCSFKDIPEERLNLLVGILIFAAGLLFLSKLLFCIRISNLENMNNWMLDCHDHMEARDVAEATGYASCMMTILAIFAFGALIVIITREIMNRLGRLGVTPPSRIMIGTVLLLAGLLCIAQYNVLELVYDEYLFQYLFNETVPDLVAELGPFFWVLYPAGALFFILAAVMLNRGIRAACMSARVPAPRHIGRILTASYFTFGAAALCSVVIASRFFIINYRSFFEPDKWAIPILDFLFIAGVVLIPVFSYLSVSTIPERKEPAPVRVKRDRFHSD
ncbi:MAG: hypothetical protein E3J72_07665 [Planctomycetota bacterium]|nr:MAG: hypothetical protein E3J72_07665 [Planctomycetota bacterium]